MTKENREIAYKNFRDIENNYNALPHLNSGITKTEAVRKRAKASADALLLRNPELEVVEEVVKEVKVKEKK